MRASDLLPALVINPTEKNGCYPNWIVQRATEENAEYVESITTYDWLSGE